MLVKLDCTGLYGDVVEFGCGYGTFTIPAAERITGKLLAMDIDKEMTLTTARKAQSAGLQNVVTIKRDFVLQGSGLPDSQVDYAMLFNILHIENPVSLLREAYRVLKPGGKAGIIHWRSDLETPRGPSMSIRPTTEQCRVWGEESGFQWVRDESLCCCSWHWGMIMQRVE